MIALLPSPASVLVSSASTGVDCGTASRFDAAAVLTCAVLVFTPNTGSGVLGRGYIGKFNGTTTGFFMRVGGTLNITVLQSRATTAISFTTTDLPVMQGQWQWFVGQFDTNAGAAAVWTGTPTSPMRANAGTLTAGSGAVTSAVGITLFLGAREPLNQGYAGRFAAHAIWERYLSPAEIAAIPSTDLRTTSPAGLWYHGVNGLGLLADVSGNGNHGTHPAAHALAEAAPAGLFAQHHGALGVSL